VQASFNTVCAIEYLKSHNVDPKVIERVLLHPDSAEKRIDMRAARFLYTNHDDKNFFEKFSCYNR
jgi:hypothetical protein